ncbi:hypothetical protein FO519_010562, partial [Halicephalobus sp. NKZ332]
MRTGEENSPFSTRESCNDLLKCDVPDDGTSCDEDQGLEEISKMFFVIHNYFVGKCNGKSYTIQIKSGDSDSDKLTLVVKEHDETFREFPPSTCGE